MTTDVASDAAPAAADAPTSLAGGFLREPLVHFLAAGAVVFGLFAAFGGEPETPGTRGAPTNVITVTAAEIEQLKAVWMKSRSRPPTADELETMIEDRIQEEVYYREALAMGLDRDDTIVRRRLKQKLEFISEDAADLVEPTDAELEAFLKAHPEKFSRDGRYTFAHVYISRRRPDAATHATKLLAELKKKPEVDPFEVGDPTLIPREFDRVMTRDVEARLGPSFAKELPKLPVGTWAGPVASGYGLHLVRVTKKVPGVVPPLKEVRREVTRELLADVRQKTAEAFYQGLRKRYEIKIERPAK